LTEERERQTAAGEVERSDTWIADRVNTVLSYDTTVNARSIEVISNDGVVLLRGTVTSLAERQVAEALAGDILGVREVESLLSFERPM
jgi:osmotically-inducible protein OsmY